jgi:hypothetical protein
MSSEITNSLRSSSVIRVTDAGSLTVQLANLSASASETVIAASIRKVIWSTNGNISIVRNSNNILTLHNSGVMSFTELGHSMANNSTSPIVITITTGGTVFLEVTKDSTYSPALTGM